MAASPDPSDLLRARADAARDARDWPQAETLYRAYLQLRPAHAALHVQLGHAVAEQGRLEEALGHYRQAAALDPMGWDPLLQLGHGLRLLGRGGESATAMAAAHALAPTRPLLRREMLLTRHRRAAPPEGPPIGPRPPAEGAPTALAFDVSDLLDYVRDSRIPTGIQRVGLGFLGALLARPDLPVPLHLVAYDPSTWRWWSLEEAAFRRMLALVRAGADAADPAWRAVIAQLVDPDSRPDAALPDGTTLVTLGNSWGIEDFFRGLRLLRARVALRYVAFLHDCVPLAMPEHCLDLTVRLYARWFAALALHADGMLANSRATAADRDRFAQALPAAPPLSVVPLATEAPPAAAAAAEAAAALLPDGAEPFVLFVATIESRKNHHLVFQAWLDLVRQLGDAAVPRLVCVGRPGWQAEPALGLQARSPELRRKVLFLTGVSDLALSGLLRRSLFTVYNSYHEGWGLPVSESLALGRLCVVPAHSGLLESGAPGAVFVPPQDGPALVEVLARLMTDPAHRGRLEARIDRVAAGRTFAQATEELAALLLAPAHAPPSPPRLPAGEHLPLGHGNARAATQDLAWADAVRDGLGWWWTEAAGVWTRDGVATLRLPVALPAGTKLRVLLHLFGPPAPLALRLRLRGVEDGGWRRLDIAARQRLSVVLQGVAAAGGVAVDLDCADGVPLGDRARRMVGVGVSGLMVCAEDDLPARLAALERAER
jgi:glycosyltransferase involved in cell wall biosynthesis